MKALTIKQPWAELIACGDKRVENRSWRTNYRGRIAVHAGLSRQLVQQTLGVLAADELVFGAVIATVDIVDCVDFCDENHRRAYRWLRSHEYAEGPWCWILENVKRLPKPIPAKGALSLWEWKE